MENEMLKNIIKKKGLTIRETANLCGISFSAFESRLEGSSEFTLGEIERVSECLALEKEDIVSIFFGEKVS